MICVRRNIATNIANMVLLVFDVLTKNTRVNNCLGPCQARTAPDGLTDVSPAATDGSNSAVGASAVKIVTIGSLVQPKIAEAACEFSGRTVQYSVQSMAGVSMTESLVPW